jgi:predicted dehydrogenase
MDPHMKNQIGLGIIGCGNISQAYFDGAKAFEVLKLVACSDINMDVANEKGKENDCCVQTVEELLANDDIDLVINLTIPSVHAEVSIKILQAGKHVHCEKPLAVHLKDAKEVLDLAKKKGLKVGCAPDTFLGAGLQTCRKVVDDGWLGKVTSGTAFMLGGGPEAWHPNPAFFYQEGAGPMFDMGPYYITALVHLLGPIQSVTAVASKPKKVRIATCKEQFGAELKVDVPTHYSGTLVFHSGAVISMTISFDVQAHGHSPIELYGELGSIKVPDPNTFGGPVELYTTSEKEWKNISLSHPYADNMRSIGAADMAYAILHDRQHRSSGELAYHALEVMHAFETSSTAKKCITIESQPHQPSAFPLGMISGRLDS